MKKVPINETGISIKGLMAMIQSLKNRKMMKKYKIVQIKSRIRKPEKQKRTLDALGIRRMNSSVIVNASPQIEGMIQKVQHLVRVEGVKE